MLKREKVNTIGEVTLEECGVHTVGDVRGAYSLLSGLRVLPTDFDSTSKDHHHREAITIRKTLGMVALSSFNEMIDEWTTEIIALIRHTYVHTWAVSSEDLAECLASEEPEDERVGVTVEEGGRNLCCTYYIHMTFTATVEPLSLLNRAAYKNVN